MIAISNNSSGPREVPTVAQTPQGGTEGWLKYIISFTYIYVNVRQESQLRRSLHVRLVANLEKCFYVLVGKTMLIGESFVTNPGMLRFTKEMAQDHSSRIATQIRNCTLQGVFFSVQVTPKKHSKSWSKK